MGKNYSPTPLSPLSPLSLLSRISPAAPGAENTTKQPNLLEQLLLHILRSVTNLERLLQHQTDFMATKSDDSSDSLGLHTPSVVKLLRGYDGKAWDSLQSEIKTLYWAGDHSKNTIAALNALIRSSNSIPLSVYVLKFSSITDVLVSKSALSDIDRFAKLLERLDEKMRNKVIKLCIQKGWRVTDQDTGEKPNFDDIKSYLEAEA
jgi:hypothetical protein